MDNDLKQTFRANVRALVEERVGPAKRSNDKGVSRLVKAGISQGTAGRLFNAETSIGLNLVYEIAVALKVAPWQLLIPGLDPKRPQTLNADPNAWPFAMVDRRSYFDLPEEDRTFVQGALSNAISGRASKANASAALGAAQVTQQAIVHALDSTAPPGASTQPSDPSGKSKPSGKQPRPKSSLPVKNPAPTSGGSTPSPRR